MKRQLSNDKYISIRKDDCLFHETIGAYDRAKLCEHLVGFLLFLQRPIKRWKLEVFKNISDPKSEEIWQND